MLNVEANVMKVITVGDIVCTWEDKVSLRLHFFTTCCQELILQVF